MTEKQSAPPQPQPETEGSTSNTTHDAKVEKGFPDTECDEPSPSGGWELVNFCMRVWRGWLK